MNLLRQPKLQISPLKLYSASTVRLPSSGHNIFTNKPSLNIPKVNFHSATSVYLPNNSNIFNTKPVIKLTPLKSPLRRRYYGRSYHNSYWNSRRKIYPEINKCNARRCSSCKYLSCESTIKSSTNGRVFPINISTDIC